MYSVFISCPFLAKVLEWCLPYEDYKTHLVNHSTMMLTVAGQVTQTKQIVAKRFNFRLRTSDLAITVSLKNLKAMLHQLVFMDETLTQFNEII